MQPKRGVKPSKTVPKGSTRSTQPPTATTTTATVVDKSDRGAKNLRPTKDRGTKNLPATRDRGAR